LQLVLDLPFTPTIMASNGVDALLQHLIARVHQDIQLLVELGHVDGHTAEAFLGRLPDVQTAHTTLPIPAAMPTATVAARMAPPQSPEPKPVKAQARALWAYNERGTVSELRRSRLFGALNPNAIQDQNDLSFSAGDIIDIIEETNDDWWTGRVHGREGLFPSNHVEKLNAPRNIPPAPAPAKKPAKKPYKPFGAVFHGSDRPPPAQRTTNTVGLQEDPKNEERKYVVLLCYCGRSSFNLAQEQIRRPQEYGALNSFYSLLFPLTSLAISLLTPLRPAPVLALVLPSAGVLCAQSSNFEHFKVLRTLRIRCVIHTVLATITALVWIWVHFQQSFFLTPFWF
jgi:LAS seventeen-binding protein 1/2